MSVCHVHTCHVLQQVQYLVPYVALLCVILLFALFTVDSTLFIIKKLVVNDNSSTGLVGTALPDHSKLMDIARVEQLTEEADVTASYVIDSSGYIVISSREDNLIGRRFAAVEPAVFGDMLDVGVYLTEVMRGYELRPCNLTLTMNTTGCLGSSAYSVYQVRSSCVYV